MSVPALSASLSARVSALSAELARCPQQCEGIVNAPATGVLPRCLFLEPGDVAFPDEGTVALGLNPGRADDTERKFVQELSRSFGGSCENWPPETWGTLAEKYYGWVRSGIAIRSPYYTLARRLIRASGRRGPILWTETVKCESREAADDADAKIRVRELQTTEASCTARYLVRELAIAPASWPILAIGVSAYEWALQHGARRRVVGVPHTSRRCFDFLALFPPLEVDAARFSWRHGTRYRIDAKGGDAQDGSSE